MADPAGTVPPVTCPVCDCRMSARRHWLWYCATCGFLSSTLPAGPGAGVAGLESLRRANFETLLKRLDAILPTRGLTLLDVGCSNGLFLEAAATYGISGIGIEPEPTRVREAQARDVQVRSGSFPGSLHHGETFDIVTFNDVFEHLSDPGQVLRVCEAILNPGGVLVLNLPDSAGVLYSLASTLARARIERPLRRLWQVELPSPHVSYFNRRNLHALVASRTGLRLIHESALRTVAAKGLRERIGLKFWDPFSILLHTALLTLVPFQTILQPDILLQIYRKPEGMQRAPSLGDRGQVQRSSHGG